MRIRLCIHEQHKLIPDPLHTASSGGGRTDKR